MNAQDREYVRRARANGAQHAYRIILEARRAGIRVPVTQARVRTLLAHGKPNGVGLTQLTDFNYVRRAERTKAARAYGAHLPANQIRVGMEVLKEKTGGHMDEAWRYNGAFSYQREIQAKQRRWHNILT
jgi:hypothetical protein